MLKPSIFTSAISIFAITISMTAGVSNAQEHEGCFMINSSNRVVSLEEVCEKGRLGIAIEAIKREENPIIANGLKLTRKSQGIYDVKGEIKNQSSRPIQLISYQLKFIKSSKEIGRSLVVVNTNLQPGEAIGVNEIVFDTKLGNIGSPKSVTIEIDDVKYKD